VGGNDGAGLCDTRFADAGTMLAAAFIGLRDDEALVGCGLGAEPAGHRLFWLGLLLLAAALAQPTDEPSDHERGQQERDDHAHADEQIGENDSGAPSMEVCNQCLCTVSRADRLAGSCIKLFFIMGKFDSTRPRRGLFIRHVFAYRLRRRAPSTCARHAPNA
jgi:hypothetical protein